MDCVLAIDRLLLRFNKSFLNVISALLILLFALTVVFKFEDIRMIDLPQYLASSQLLSEGLSPYSFVNQRTSQVELAPHLTYISANLYLPPIVLPVIYFLKDLTFAEAKVLYFILFFVSLFLAVTLVSKTKVSLLDLALVLFSIPFIACLQNGQITIILFLFLALHLYFYQQEKFFLSGLCLSLTFMKPQLLLYYYLFLLFKILVEKRFLLFYGTSLGIAVLSMMATLLRPSIWWEFYSFFQEASLVTNWKTNSLYSFLRIYGWESYSPLISFSAFAFFVFLVVNPKIKSWHPQDQLSLAILGSLTFCTYFWNADTMFVVLVLWISLKYSYSYLIFYVLISLIQLVVVSYGIEHRSFYWHMPSLLLVGYYFFAYHNKSLKSINN